MSELLFVVINILFGLLLFIFKKNKIDNFLGNNRFLYYCLSIMFISNLGFSSVIQFSMRIFGVVYSFIILLLYLKKYNNIKINKPFLLIFIYIVFCLFSTLYSVSKVQTLFKSIELLIDFFIVITLYSIEDREKFVIRTFQTIFVISFFLLISNILSFILLSSKYSGSKKSLLGFRLNGFLGSNKAGALSVICIIWVLLLKNRKDKMYYSVLLISILTAFLSQSRSTLILIPVILFIKMYQPKDRFKYFIIFLLILLFVLNNMDLIWTYVLRGQTESQMADLTGRVNMWEASYKYIRERPVFGYGFGAGGEIVALNMYGASTMHSGIYETLLGTGYTGLILLMIQYFYVFIKVFFRTISSGIKNNLADIIFVLYFLIRSYTSLGIANWHSQEIVIWYLIFIVLCGNSLQKAFDNKGEL